MTEIELMANRAWREMARPASVLTREFGGGPMPPAIALDMVQDVSGDRDEAVTAVLGAAARWLESTVPATDMSNARFDAVAIVGNVRGEAFGLADSLRQAIDQRAYDVRLSAVMGGHRRVPPEEFDTAIAWNAWCNRAAIAIALGRALVAAAHPIDQA